MYNPLHIKYNIAFKVEEEFNSALLDIKKRSLLIKTILSKAMFNRSTIDEICWLIKSVQERIFFTQYCLSGICYYNLNNFLKPVFDKIRGANIEMSTLDARRKLESIKLRPDESMVSLDVKSLLKNVPVNDAIQIAWMSRYSNDHAPEMPRSNLKMILKLAETNFCFHYNDRWFCQRNGLAIRASFAVTLESMWMKSFEHQNTSTKEITNKFYKHELDACHECKHRVVYR